MADFDPEAFLKETEAPAEKPFDPEAFLRETAPPPPEREREVVERLRANQGDPSYFERQLYSNLVKGVAGLPGVPGYLADAIARGGLWAGKKAAGWTRGAPLTEEEERRANEAFEPYRPANYLPTPETFIKPVEEHVTGPLPQEDPDKPLQNIGAAGLAGGMFGPVGAIAGLAGKTAETLAPEEYKEAAGLIGGALGPRGARTIANTAANTAARINWVTEGMRTPRPPEAGPPAPPGPPAAAPPLAPEAAALTPQPREGLSPNVRLLRPDIPHDIVTANPGVRDSVGAARAQSALDQASPEAIRILEDVARSEGWTEHTLDQLEEGQSAHHMLGETSNNTEALTKATQTLPGPARNEVQQAVNARHYEQPQRLEALHSKYLGPAVDRTQWRETLERAAREESAPFWEAFDAKIITPTPEIEAVLARPGARAALRRANETLLNRGQKIENGFPVLTEEEAGGLSNTARRDAEEGLRETRVPTARAFQLLKEAIDDRIGAAVRAGERGEVRTYTTLKKDLDAAIAAHPDKSIAQTWQQARQTYRGPMSLINAREMGQGLLGRGVNWSEIPGLIEGMSPEQLEALRLGMRDRMADIAGRGGPQGLRQIREAIGPDNHRKIAAVIGDERADAYISALLHEEHLHFAPRRLIHGSDTGQNIAYRDMLQPQPGMLDKISLGDVAGAAMHPVKTTMGLAGKGAEAWQAKRMAAANERWENVIRPDLARLLTTQGAERDAIRRAIVQRIQEGEGGLGGPAGRQPFQRNVLERDRTGRPIRTRPFSMKGDERILEEGARLNPMGGRPIGERNAPVAAGAEAERLPGRGELAGGEGRLAPPGAAAQAAGGEHTAPLVGLPARVKVPGVGHIDAGPHLPARAAAEDYMREAGLPYDPPKVYAKVDPERAGRIAQAFEEMKHDPHDPEVKAAYKAMADETMAQWEAMKRTGLKVEFIEGADPYEASPRLATEDVRKNNHLYVFPTDAGFGTKAIDAAAIADNPLLALSGETISGKPARLNDIFRAVHDYYGHIKEGVGFRADGEENAWRSHSAMYSPEARRAMTTETRGQNSWLNYGPHGEANRTARSADTIYADQKIGLLPRWVSEEGATDAGINPMGGQPLARDVTQRDVRGRPLRTNPMGMGREGQVLEKGYEEATAPRVRAYHGSPHDFEKFDIGKIGTGEGAQAYGHGLYFAENPQVAKDYRQNLGGKEYVVNGKVVGRYGEVGKDPIGNATARVLQVIGGDGGIPTAADVSAAKAKLLDVHKKNPGIYSEREIPRIFEAMDNLVGQKIGQQFGGKTYEVAIKAHPDEFLDWDKPLSEQHPKVQEALNKAWLAHPEGHAHQTGRQIYEATARDRYNKITKELNEERDALIAKYNDNGNLIAARTKMTPEERQREHEITTMLVGRMGEGEPHAAQALREAGIPGIKYLDQGSRANAYNVELHTSKGKYADKSFATKSEADRYADEKRAEGFTAHVKDQGSRNFVVFDDKLINTLRKYHEGGPIHDRGLRYLFAGGRVTRASGGKVTGTRAASHYSPTRGTSERHCGNCWMFRKPHSCISVAGWIVPKGLCDWWEHEKRTVA